MERFRPRKSASRFRPAAHTIELGADRPRAITLGADKAYDAEDFVNGLRSMNATPHVAERSTAARRGTRAMRSGQRIRKWIEEAIGWIKTIAGQERTKFRGRERVGWAFILARPPPTIWRACQSSWRPRHEGPRPPAA